MKKIAECSKNKGCSGGVVLDIHQNSSVQYHITKLQQDHCGIYWASLFINSGPPKESNKVQVFVQKENSSNTGKVPLHHYMLHLQEMTQI